jgi:hypothetical protein
MIRRILAPVFGVDDDQTTLDTAAAVGKHFHAHVEVVKTTVGSEGSCRLCDIVETGWQRASGDATALHERPTHRGNGGFRHLFDRWRERYRIPEQPEFQYNGLVSAALLELAGPVETTLSQRAKFSDIICLAVRPSPSEEKPQPVVRQLLLSTGRPLLLMPIGNGHEAIELLGEPIVIGWNGSVEAVHTLTAALPFIRRSRNVEIIRLDETSSGAVDAFEVRSYLLWHGVRARAVGVGHSEWTGGDLIDLFRHRRAGLAVMGGHVRDGGELGNATQHMLARIPLPVLMSA